MTLAKDTKCDKSKKEKKSKSTKVIVSEEHCQSSANTNNGKPLRGNGEARKTRPHTKLDKRKSALESAEDKLSTKTNLVEETDNNIEINIPTKRKSKIVTDEVVIKKNKKTDITLKKQEQIENNNIENIKKYKIIIVNNLSYKETEASIKSCFTEFGTIEKVQLQKNKEGKFIGKAIVSFVKMKKIDREITLNNKILRIENVKDKLVNDKRVFISRLDRNLKILEIRNILKECGVKPVDIRTRFDTDTKKNPGYCHVTWKCSRDAQTFESKWGQVKDKFGNNAFYEYANEKIDKIKRRK